MARPALVRKFKVMRARRCEQPGEHDDGYFGDPWNPDSSPTIIGDKPPAPAKKPRVRKKASKRKVH